MSESYSHYGQTMALLGVVSLCVSAPVSVLVIAFALMALKKEPRLGAILICLGYSLSILLLATRFVLGMCNYTTWLDIYFKVQIGLSILGLLTGLMIGAGIVLLIYGHVLSRTSRNEPPKIPSL